MRVQVPPQVQCNDLAIDDGTDAMYEMETWECPDTNRTDITTLYAGVAE